MINQPKEKNKKNSNVVMVNRAASRMIKTKYLARTFNHGDRIAKALLQKMRDGI